MAKSTTVSTVIFVLSFIIGIVSYVIPLWAFWDGITTLRNKKTVLQGLWYICTSLPSEKRCEALDTSSLPDYMIATLVLETVGIFFAIVAFIIVVTRKRISLLKGFGPLAGALVAAGAIVFFTMYDGWYDIHAGVGLAVVAGAGMVFSGLYMIAIPDEEEMIPLEKRI